MKTSSPDWLSPRECEVLQHLARGESFKSIANELEIHQGTAQNLAHRAYLKLGVNDRFGAVERHPPHRPTPERFCNKIVLASQRIAIITSTAIAASTHI